MQDITDNSDMEKVLVHLLYFSWLIEIKPFHVYYCTDVNGLLHFLYSIL